MRWFRFYSEFAKDIKVQMLSEAYQRRLVMIFCLHCEGDLQKLNDAQLSYALGISKKELEKTLLKFFELGFLTKKNEKKYPSNWDKRQFKSDDVSQRVKSFRNKALEAECNVTETLQKRYRNVTVTAPEADTDTDTETDTEEPVVKEKLNKDFKLAAFTTSEPAALHKNISKKVQNKISDRQGYIDYLLPAFPSGGTQIFLNETASAMFDLWHERGVTVEDVSAAVAHSLERGQSPKYPKFFENKVLEFCHRRKSGGSKKTREELEKEKRDEEITKIMNERIAREGNIEYAKY